MTERNQVEARELLPFVLGLSETLSECTPYGREAERYLYSTIFVRAAKENNLLSVVDEFCDKWERAPLNLFQLLPELFDMFGDLRNPEWSSVRTHVNNFYKAYNKTGAFAPSSFAYDPSKKIPQRFRPLPSMYHSIRNEIEKFKESKAERHNASQLLLSELQEFESNYSGTRCPVRRRNVNLARIAEPADVWKAKEEGFRLIFQRTRELFLFQDEEAHFHHAAAILEFIHEKLKQQYKPEYRNDQVALAKHAEGLRCFQMLYVKVMEKSQECLKMDGTMQFVTSKLALSRNFRKVRSLASKDFEKSRKLLGGMNCAVPGLVEGKASLAVSLYGLLHERRLVYDEAAYYTDKMKKQLHQLDEWERLTGVRRNTNSETDEIRMGGEGEYGQDETLGD